MGIYRWCVSSFRHGCIQVTKWWLACSLARALSLSFSFPLPPPCPRMCEPRHERPCTHTHTHTHTFFSTSRVAYLSANMVKLTSIRPTSKSLEFGTSLVAQWLRIRLPMQGTRVRALVWEDPTCRGATMPVRHSY